MANPPTSSGDDLAKARQSRASKRQPEVDPRRWDPSLLYMAASNDKGQSSRLREIYVHPVVAEEIDVLLASGKTEARLANQLTRGLLYHGLMCYLERVGQNDPEVAARAERITRQITEDEIFQRDVEGWAFLDNLLVKAEHYQNTNTNGLKRFAIRLREMRNDFAEAQLVALEGLIAKVEKWIADGE